MRLSRQNKSIIISIFVLAGIVFSSYFLLRYNENIKINKSSEQAQGQENSPLVAEPRILRSQATIAKEYKQNIEKILGEIQIIEDDYDEIFEKSQSGFFDILVPNDLRDLHVQTLLEIQGIEFGEEFKDTNDLREQIINLLNILLEENEKIK